MNRALRTPFPRSSAPLVLLLLVAFLLPLARAQTSGAAQTPTPAAQRAADGAMEGWLRGEFAPDPTRTQNLQQLERAIIDQLRFAPAPQGASTNYALRRFVGRDAQTRRETFRYPVGSDAGDFEVDVTVRPTSSAPTPDGWEAYTVRATSGGPSLPDFLYDPLAPWVFGALSLLMVLFAARSGVWRNLLWRGLSVAREQRRVFLWVAGTLYGLFVLGNLLAFAAPNLARELTDLLSSGVEGIGIVQLAQGGVAPAATGIAYWNFVQGAVNTTFLPGLLFGIPALLFNAFRFALFGLGLSPALLGGLPYLLHVPTIIIELGAYIFVTASSMALLWRGRKVGWGQAFLDYFYSLPIALFLLVLAAWYEALELLILLPLLTGRT